MALSISEIYFRHYKVQSSNPTLSALRCSLINLSIRNGTPLQRWTRGLSIMLEKAPGKILVLKLRVIHLLKANFNTLYKIIFNCRILPALESKNLISIEVIGSRRSQSTIYMALNKKLITNVANQAKSSLVIVSADITNCYN